MTKMDGRVLRPLEPSLPDDELFELYAQMGGTLRRFHDVRMEGFGYLVAEGVMDPHPTNEAYMLFQFGKKLKEFRDLGGDVQLSERMERYVALHATLLKDCAWPVFCHDDFHTANVIVSKGVDDTWRLSGVVDVENAVADDPLIDVAKTLLYSVGKSQAKRDGFLTGYGPIERRDWGKTISLYRLYHALEWWDWVALVGGDRPSGLIEEMELITAST